MEERENVDLSLYMYMDGTIDERDDAKEKKKKKEEKRKIDEQSLSFFRSEVDD